MELIKSFEHPKIPGLTINFYAEWDNVYDIDGSSDYPEDIARVKQGVHDDDMCRWFVAKIEIDFMGITCADYLGQCSYESFDDFLNGGDYISDMISTVTSELKTALTEIMGNAESIINKIERAEK